ncbi:YbaB/EbfC family nucleoid-associated protein [Glycomyces tarimensis]
MPADETDDMRRRAMEVQRIATEAQAEAVSEHGEVLVVASPGGRIKELDLRQSAFQMSGVELGEMIVETIRTANHKLETELTATISGILGAGLTNPTGDEEPQR